jgi:hypothetical protein
MKANGIYGRGYAINNDPLDEDVCTYVYLHTQAGMQNQKFHAIIVRFKSKDKIQESVTRCDV